MQRQAVILHRAQLMMAVAATVGMAGASIVTAMILAVIIIAMLFGNGMLIAVSVSTAEDHADFRQGRSTVFGSMRHPAQSKGQAHVNASQEAEQTIHAGRRLCDPFASVI